ncbi:hypothetical protein CUC04_05995 [Prevotella intermedia]|uniref:Uncharacterized protein n=1 Tax=Prevotella intermedia TaxID=28131 RepID=A0A2G9IGU9_PREIN|nr:hypothetical protein CUC04_05995 [Prevotella intermedia]
MQGKSGSFGVQKLRFRNAKAQLSLFNRIIFTKLDGKSHQLPSVIKMYLNALFVKLREFDIRIFSNILSIRHLEIYKP